MIKSIFFSQFTKFTNYIVCVFSSPLFCPSSMVPYIDEPPSPTSPVHLITINLKPDSDGKFGFNVKGGSDQNCPILVSRVAPNTPADLADPKMKEGDQVMAINGADCDGKTHQEVCLDSINLLINQFNCMFCFRLLI